MICYDIKNDYNRAFLTIWGRLLEQKAYSRDRTSHHIPRNPLVAILSESVIYEEEGYKAIPIKEAKETMHASLVYVKGMYQRNAVKEFFKRMQIR